MLVHPTTPYFVPITRLTRELEKKLSDKYIIFLSQRRVLPKPKRNSAAASGQKRPRSRTLTAVHEKILDEMVWPSEIVGKRTRVAQDGGKLIRVYVIPFSGVVCNI
jgi:small subunit ribosomal protein S7e